MTENEALSELETFPVNCLDFKENEALDIAIKSIKENQRYKALIGLTEEDFEALEKDQIQTIGDVLRTFSEWYKFKEIGTVEEFRILKEKSQEESVSEWRYYNKEDIAACKKCSYEHYLGEQHQYARKFCPNCGSKMMKYYKL